MKTKLKYLFTLSSPLAVFLSFQGGPWSFTGLIYAFGIIPGLELLLSSSKTNLNEEKEKEVLEERFFDLLVWSMVPIQYGLLFSFCFLLSQNNYQWWEYLGMTLSMGTACGVLGINVAHELGHRTTWYEKVMALSLLLTSQYIQFFIEHNRFHNKMVSTP
ncbi:MAG: hypothetical protein NXH75_09195 [Halobacteriovoraceae bacterium]|nr:hypothetical protein [Halobacteriovoraceae bacterium]